MDPKNQVTSPKTSPKIYVVCLNPFCPKESDRCLDSMRLHKHPQECCRHYFPAELIMKTDWQQIQNYPSDSLGQSVRQKYQKCSLNSFLHQTVQDLKIKLEKSIDQLEKKLNQLYPILQLEEYYTSVYNLQKVAESLKMKHDPAYISNIINNNFLRPKYNALLMLNQSYDNIKSTVDNLYNHMNHHINQILKKHNSFQQIQKTKTHKQLRKIKYDLVKSKFITSSDIEVKNGNIEFPKVKNISSFLPWIYGEKYFQQGVHQLKISSIRFPLVQNSGFTVLEECDSDTYPYSTYKSLFNREGRGFKLVKGDHIQTFIAKSTVVTLRLQLDSSPKALLFDSEMKCVYECPLRSQTNYRMGVYGGGWSIILLQIS